MNNMDFPRVSKRQQTMTKPLVRLIQGLLFSFLRTGSRVEIWLYENTELRIEGKIIGFDEFMNIVLEDACEISSKRPGRKPIGRILLKGDNLALVKNA
jgi:small nuclear ribonucleoprotein E